MGKILKTTFHGDLEDLRRKAHSDFRFLGFSEEPNQAMLKHFSLMMFRLARSSDALDVEGFPLSDGKLAYRWLMFRLGQQAVDFPLLRRQIVNAAKDLGVSEIQLVEFYRLLLIDLTNHHMIQLHDEAPLVVEKRKRRTKKDKA